MLAKGVDIDVHALRRMSSRAFSSGAVTSSSWENRLRTPAGMSSILVVVAINTRDSEMISCNTGAILSAVNASIC